MIDYSNIPHPLLSDSGTCQSERFPSMLNPESVKIDDQSIEDILQFINKYARFVNFYEAKQINNSRFEENHELHISNWQDFFSKSLPFQLAALVKKDVQELEANMDNILALIDEAPLADNIQLLLDFIFSELILVFDESLSNVDAARSSFSTVLKRMMTSGLRASVMAFIGLTKQLVNDLGLKGIAFGSRLQFDNWDIPNSNSIAATSYSTLQEMLDQLVGHANVFMRALRNLALKTSEYLPKALYPAKEEEQGRISPHVGLLLAFLQLKKKFTLNLNDLTRRHLLHFYNDVLQIKGRPAIPDETFVVFQLQKQVENSYLLRKGTRVKDGKDDNKADIIFELEKDVVLDKTEVTELRTLFVNYNSALLEAKKKDNEPVIESCSEGKLNRFIEGLYMAPKANSADGVEEDFKEDPKNWSTLGARESKFLEGGAPKLHPSARLGLILASPVLYLQEGKRKILITLNCSHSFNTQDQDIVNGINISDLFNVCLSGEKGWLSAPSGSVTTQFMNLTNTSVDLLIQIDLMDDFEAVTFSDAEVLEEEIGTTHPSVKIELNADNKIKCPTKLYNPCCTLLHCQPGGRIDISAYQLLCQLEIENSTINVEVCGVKNLIVQNDEALQDVKSPIYPFGTRPNVADFNRDFIHRVEDPADGPNLVGPSFYIGSKEVLLKAWDRINVNISWKEKPADFKELYLAYRYDDENNDRKIDKDTELYGLAEKDFEINLSVLKENRWYRENDTALADLNNFTGHNNRKLFAEDWTNAGLWCNNFYNESIEKPFDQVIRIAKEDFTLPEHEFEALQIDLDALKPDTRNGFLRLTLENQDFLHKDYAFVLARQMMALGNITNGEALEGAVYIDSGTGSIIVFNNISGLLFDLYNDITLACELAEETKGNASDIKDKLDTIQDELSDVSDELAEDDPNLGTIASEFNEIVGLIDEILDGSGESIQDLVSDTEGVEEVAVRIKEARDAVNFLSGFFTNTGVLKAPLEVPIPNEPWTPIIKDITIDYKAKAIETDIQLIHLYPFESTYKVEDITKSPSLLPRFKDEGTLFIALDKVTKGNTLNLLFHLAEATANTEMNKPTISWSYLTGNDWQPLRPGFSVLHDGTDGLTKSGIVEISIPADISKAGHTIMPPEQYWIKASAEAYSKAVCETIGIYTQAAKVIAKLSPENDPKRLEEALPAEQINRLDQADSSIKKVLQPIESFYGKPPESDSPNRLYRRISERLRHKDRAITGFDYERITLENFPQVFKAKTINHTLGLPATEYIRDLEVAAPGFVTLAVIPDIHQLDIGGALEPRIPLSQLEQIREHLITRNSPFVRLKVMNPRYEKVNVAIKVRFQDGNSGPYFQDLLAKDIKAFLAPWLLGKTDRLEFGAALSKSDLIAFVEQLNYIDYICQIDWVHEFDLKDGCLPKAVSCTIYPKEARELIAPLTARSILTAGKIEVCELDRLCETYDPKVECKEDAKIF